MIWERRTEIKEFVMNIFLFYLSYSFSLSFFLFFSLYTSLLFAQLDDSISSSLSFSFSFSPLVFTFAFSFPSSDLSSFYHFYLYKTPFAFSLLLSSHLFPSPFSRYLFLFQFSLVQFSLNSSFCFRFCFFSCFYCCFSFLLFFLQLTSAGWLIVNFLKMFDQTTILAKIKSSHSIIIGLL